MMRLATYYVIANLVVSCFLKDRDIRENWCLLRVTTENKAWITCAIDYGVVCQRHFIDYDYRPIQPFGD